MEDWDLGYCYCLLRVVLSGDSICERGNHDRHRYFRGHLASAASAYRTDSVGELVWPTELTYDFCGAYLDSASIIN